MKKQYIGIGLLLIAAVAVLSGCGGTAAAAEEVTEVPVVTQDVTDVVAEAVIEPARWAALSFEVPGDVLDILVQEGDSVQENDVLVRLETEALARALAQAELSLQQAELRLAQLQEPADESDVAVAQSAVSDALAAYEEAQGGLTLTEHSTSVGDDVRAARYWRDETYRIYQDLEGSDAGETQVNAAHDAYLDALGAYNRAVEGSQLQLTTAQNTIDRAYHALVQAQYNLDNLLDGADATDVELSRLDVEAAQLALEAAQDSLEEATLAAPFAGVVASVDVEPGDAVAPGTVVVTLATLDQLQARTTDLTELDIVRVEPGQSAVVTVDAMPDDPFTGTVTEIALQPGDYRGDVVYTVVVDVTDIGDAPVRWGMTALVEIATE